MNRIQSIIKALIAIAMLWPLSAWAYTIEGDTCLVDNWADLKTCMAAGGYIKLTGNCTDLAPTNLTCLSVPSTKTVTLDLNGKTIDRGLSNNAINGGYVIYVEGNLTITGGGTITGGNNSSSDGPGCIWHKKGNLTIQNCTISGNKGKKGGAINLEQGGGTPTCTIKEGTVIRNNTACKGGGIYIYQNCTITIEGGSIIENTAIESASSNDAAGGGVYSGGTLNLKGGIIKKNICSNTSTTNNNGGGGIYYPYNSRIYLSGNPVVQENKNREKADDNVKLYKPNDPMIIYVTGTLDPAARIGINMYGYSTSYPLTNGLSGKGGSSNFTSDNPDYCIVIDNNGEVRQYTHWEKLYYKSFAQSGEVQLDRDIYAPASNASSLTVNNGIEITLDLNGHKIDMAGKNIYINVRGSLTIKDSYKGTDRTHTITVDENPITITGGLITGSTYQGINNNGTLVLESGTIAGNGGGISIQAGKTATIIGGTISYNRSTTADKAGVYLVNSTSVLNVRGTPVIKNNKYVSGDTNTDKNVYLPSGSKVTITGNLEEKSQMGITYGGSLGSEFTSGLNGKGTISNFVPDNASYLIRTTNEGEAMLTTAYNITVANATNGTVSTSAAIGAQGDVITVTATPDDGYYLSALTAGSEDILASKQFTIGSSNVTVTATFASKMEISPTVSLDNWVYGNAANAPAVERNTGNGDVSYLYKVKDADDNTYTETVPTTVGTYTVKATVAESTQYFGATATADFTITKRPVTITSGITANNKTYDGTTDAAIGTANAVFDGKIESDGLTVSTTGTFADKDVGTGKTVNLGELTLGGTSVDNYKLAESGHQTTTTANITPLTLTVTADNATKTYGEDNPPFTIQYSGFLSGEDETTALTTLPTATCEATISSNVGSYNIVPDNGVATNYTFNYVSGRLIINPKSLTENMVTITDATTVYNGNSQKPTITIEDTDDNVNITTNDYNISNDGSGTNVGTYSVVINGTNNYSGTVTKSDCFTITPKSIAGVTIAAIADQTYTGSAITPATVITDTDISPTPTLTENTDYTLSYSTNNTNVTGENVTITVTGKGNYDSSTSTSTTFLIVPKALEDGMIAAIADQAYTGSDIEPELAVTYNGMNLSRDTHYTAAFDNNTNTTGSGTATVTITACDNSNYSGTASASFNIVAADLSTAEVTGTSKNVDFGSSTSPAIDPLAVNFPAADYTIAYRKTYQPPIVDVTTIPTDIIGTYKVVLKPTDTGNLTGEKVTDYVVNVQLPVILKQCEWVTYFDERFDLATPSGYQAYKVSAAAVSGVTLEAIDYIPKGVPVILKTTASGISETTMNVKFDEQQETSEIIGDVSFIGVPSTATDGVLPDGTAYILVSDEFILFEGTEAIPKHRCYLKFASAGTRSIGINIEGEGTTGIDSSDIQRKEMGHWYDLQGRRIEKPTQKGIYIKDGKKIVIGKEVRL